jgi:hypothetical protein
MANYKDPLVKKNDAIAAAGSASKLSRLLNINRAAITMWQSEMLPPIWAYRVLQIFPDIERK